MKRKLPPHVPTEPIPRPKRIYGKSHQYELMHAPGAPCGVHGAKDFAKRPKDVTCKRCLRVNPNSWWRKRRA